MEHGERLEASEQLMRRIALGRQWIDEIVSRKIDSPKELAARERRTESYIYDVLRAGCVAPSIVDGLINGQSTGSSSVPQIKNSLPIDWIAQRAALQISC